MNHKNKLFIFNEELKTKSIKSFTRTKYCRFKASDRLKFYSTISNWVFTLISLLLIIASLLDVYNIFEKSSFFNFYQTSLAITILVFFQVIANSSYELKSLRFHQCAIEISKILQKLEHISVVDKADEFDESSKDKIKQILNEYSSILKRYENHETIDFLEYKKFTMEEKNKKEESTDKSMFFLEISIFFRKYIIGLFPQFILTVVALIGFIYSFSSFIVICK